MVGESVSDWHTPRVLTGAPSFVTISTAIFERHLSLWRITMQKAITALIGAAFALAMAGTQAGVAPALGGNKMSASGAKIAPPSKSGDEERKEEKTSDPKELPKQ